MRRLTADTGVDLVEYHRLAAADGRDRQRDPGQLAARRGLRDGCEREARVRPDQERDVVRSGRAGVALPELGPELAFAEADALELGFDRAGERFHCGVAVLR